ncbi:triple tyrosine motif-containing protein [Congregibacter variabilis]|uniref:Triple tyrosine motif-containing protein n=1 Tax=Congregibacter variabilis TaxID=3081200 RepID=A0ABZ0I1N4_9GAMM|nr:triple tyrosine motif-containing protein [Congregibacter sp. IMCC43200]
MNFQALSIAAFAFCCISNACFGEETWNEWRVESQSATSILSNHTITLIKKTSPRELWIASTEGIFLFDGIRTERKPIRWIHNDELPLKRAIDFVRGSDGSVYLFTIRDGVYRISPDRDQFESIFDINSETKTGRIDAVTVSSERNVALILADNRVFSLTLSTTNVSEVIIDTRANNNVASGLLASRDGEIYVLFDGYVVRLAWQVDRFAPQKNLQCDLKLAQLNSSTQTPDGHFYVSDNFGELHRLLINGEQCTRQETPKSLRNVLSDSRVNAVRFLHDSNVLAISTDKGLLLAANQSVKRISTQNSLMRSDEVISVDEATKDNIVIGSFVGLMHATKSPFISVNRLPFERKPTIVAIASAAGAGTFVATKKGLYREIQHDNGISFAAIDLSRTHATVSALEITTSELWVGFGDGRLLRCEFIGAFDSCNHATEVQLSKSPITSISKASALGSAVLVTALNGKAFIVKNSETSLAVNLLFELDGENSKLLAVETDVELAWFFDLEGAWTAPLSAIKKLTSEAPGGIEVSRYANRSWAMADIDGAVFLATPGGEVMLYREKDVSLKEVSPVWSGSVKETIFAIEVDFLGRPWIATSSGLWLRHNDEKFNIQVRTDGVDAIAADYGASHTDYRGNVYFGGTGGLLRIHTPGGYPQPRSGSVALTSVRLNETQLKIRENFAGKKWLLQVSDRATKIEFKFGLRQMLWFQTATYQHKLEGFDTDWRDSGNANIATYQNLPPGKYTFRARGADSAGVWSDNEVSLPVEVLPPIWRSWWALLAYFALALGALLYLKRINDRHVAHEERLKLAEEGSAAFARLEDDYQAQREANETLLLRRAPSAKSLLDVVETALMAQLAGTDSHDAISALVGKLRTLHTLQTLTDRTTSQERTDLHAVTEEIAARLAASNEVAARAIISNDVSKSPVPLEHAVYIGLVIQEALELAITGRRFENLMDPLVFISMSKATLTQNNEYSYELRIEDSGLKGDDTNALEHLLPLTFHLMESGGGELSEDYDAGNILSVKLLFQADTSL